MLDVFTADNPVRVPKIAGTGVVIVVLAVPLQSPETVKFIEEPLITEVLSPLCHGNDRVEITAVVPPLLLPPLPPPQEVSTTTLNNATSANGRVFM
jgi:hypothetical protein